jgi:hypothetical protein
MTGRRGQLKIMNDKCLQIALVAILVVREWIARQASHPDSSPASL